MMIISAKHLDKYFNKGKSNEIHVINDISLELPATGITAIFGRSGCGKTTLLNVLGGLDRVNSGTVEIDGKPFSCDDDYTRNRYIGYIFQNYNLSPDKSVFDNVADILKLCGVRDEELIKDRVMTALSNVGLEKFSKRLPGSLSGGQQQRVAIARATVKSPRIILADEPTGNLDEANTVMVMDMLKKISETCLVILVTHEEKLVDHYCETVIQLSDGQVTGVRENGNVNGYSLRSRNDVYLGELEEVSERSDRVELKYYGKAPSAPIGIRIVNTGERILLKIDDPTVGFIDDSSEIRLIDGVYEAPERGAGSDRYGGFAELPPLPEARKSDYGKLYRFFGTFGKMFRRRTVKHRKGKAFLRVCMALLAGVTVLLTAIYGEKLSEIGDVAGSFNRQMFYVGGDIEGAGEKLDRALSDPGSGIDWYCVSMNDYKDQISGESLQISPDYFVTGSGVSVLETRADTLPFRLAGETRLLAGEKDSGSSSMWITRTVADDLLKNSRVGYLSSYEDLVGTVNVYENLVITAVLDTAERAVFVSEDRILELSAQRKNLYIGNANGTGTDVAPGTAVFCYTPDDEQAGAVRAGDTVMISGREFRITETKEFFGSYEDWLRAEHGDVYGTAGSAFGYSGSASGFYEKLASDEAFARKLGIIAGGDSADTLEKKYPFAVYEYLYGYFDEYVEYCVGSCGVCSGFSYYSRIAEQLYIKYGISDAKYLAYGGDFNAQSISRYFFLIKYREAYGRDPDDSVFSTESPGYIYSDRIEDASFYAGLNPDRALAVFGDHAVDYAHSVGVFNVSVGVCRVFILSPDDYRFAALSWGVTSDIADDGNWLMLAGDQSGWRWYTPTFAVHSSDVSKTEKYLASEFRDAGGTDGGSAVVTPSDVLGYVTKEQNADIAGGLVPFAVILVLLALCVYFIIRSDLMNRVREVGIYRAIGVTKRNLRFEFLAETAFLAFTSVLPGFVLSSAVLFYMLGRTSYAARFLFYPVWLSVLVLAFLGLICAVCGILPINRLLRKTPAEILSKYDI